MMPMTLLSRFITIFLAFAAFLLAPVLSHAQESGQAGILLTPTRLILEGRQRSASVSLANNGTATGTYRIEFVNKRMTEDGRFENVTEAKPGDMFADKILRVSPRRVILKPGEHQNIRLLVRKPPNFPEGEYRSHMRVVLIPNAKLETKDKSKNANSLSISIHANFGMTIPIIIRNGNLTASGKMANIAFAPKSKNTPPTLTFDILRQGNESLYGDIRITYTSPDGKDTVIKSMGGLAIYTPNTKRHFVVPLDIPDGVSIQKGKIRVTYRKKEEEGGSMIAEGALNLYM